MDAHNEKKIRIDFTPKTKSIIARRAGYRCSKCDKTLVGPGVGSDEVVELGEGAHIYSANPDGPRGQGHLTKEQLRSPENGIYLCSHCHNLVDGKLSEKMYSAATLLQLKAIHEYKIAIELGNKAVPLNWIKSIRIEESPNIKSGSVVSFSKTTILYGDNGSGKSSIIEMLNTILTSEIDKRWFGDRMKATVDVDNPVKAPVTVTMDNYVTYKAGDDSLASFPYQMDVVYLKDKERPTEGDDLQYVADYLRKSKKSIEAMISVADYSYAVMVKNAEVRNNRIFVWRKDENTEYEWKLRQLSSTERSRFVLDLVISYLFTVSKYKPSLFLIDWSNIYSFDEKLMGEYMKILQNPRMNFQTIIASHRMWQNVEWSGWNLVDFNKYEIVDDR